MTTTCVSPPMPSSTPLSNASPVHRRVNNCETEELCLSPCQVMLIYDLSALFCFVFVTLKYTCVMTLMHALYKYCYTTQACPVVHFMFWILVYRRHSKICTYIWYYGLFYMYVYNNWHFANISTLLLVYPFSIVCFRVIAIIFLQVNSISGIIFTRIDDRID